MIEIDLNRGADWGGDIDWLHLSETCTIKAIENSNYNQLNSLPLKFSISINLSNNVQVHALNKQYRNKDKPTNILSFPMLDQAALESASTNAMPEMLLGDLILSYQLCSLEAEQKNITIIQHFQHLIIHGILHLLGYNHIEDIDADVMQAIEIKTLNDLGVDDPYEKG